MSTDQLNALSGRVIGAAIEVHRELGPGLDEPDYEVALSAELTAQGIGHKRQQPLPVIYKGIALDCGYRMDVLVEGVLILELKSVVAIHPIHEAQLLTYLRLSDRKLGLLMNFDVPLLKEGIRRKVLGLEEDDVRKQGPSTMEGLVEPSRRQDRNSFDALSNHVLGAAIEVHRQLGRGLLKSAYEECVAHELSLRGTPFERKKPVVARFRDISLPKPVEIDMVVAGTLPLMFASVTDIPTLFEARLLGRLKLGNWPFGLLLNFNGDTLSEGVRRIVNPQFRRR